jgi:signal transduction histidine kinase
VLKYISEGKQDSAYLTIADFKKRGNLKQTDLFKCELFHGELLGSVNRFKEAIEAYRRGIACLLPADSGYRRMKAVAEMCMASTYFTLQNFDSSYFYCNLSFKDLPLSSLGYRGENREIVGYYYFVRGDYENAIRAYNEALEIYSGVQSAECAGSSVYNKVALIYSKQKQFKKALELAKKAVKLSDSCGLEDKVLTYISLTNVYTDAGMFKEALDVKYIVDSLNSLKTTRDQDQRVLEIEAKYQTQLRQKENETLKEINQEKEEVVKAQQKIIVISIVTILVFAGLLFFLVRSFNQRNRINRELQAQKAHIENVNKDLERLNLLNQKIFSVISHDFKGPVLTLEMLLETFRKKNTDAEWTPYINDIITQLNNANEILSNLLNWAKTEINISVADNTPTNLESIGAEIIRQVRSAADQKGITIHYKIDRNAKLNVPSDIVRIVLRNLLSNAIKFSHKNSEITVAYSAVNNQLSVSDNGIGIDEEKINRLFRQDVMSTLGTSNEPGFGMGLYIVAELLHKYKCSITVRSRPGNGATFIVTFPNEF